MRITRIHQIVLGGLLWVRVTGPAIAQDSGTLDSATAARAHSDAVP